MAKKIVGMLELLDDIGTCCICKELFSDPRILPCIHTFCLECLDKAGESLTKKPIDEMPCPVCRQIFTIPPEGMSGLPKNFFITRLIEFSTLSKPKEKEAVCDVCLANKENCKEETPLAEMFCVECQENMCSRCSMEHKRQKPCREHQIVTLESLAKEQGLLFKRASNQCAQHAKEPLKMYCVDCQSVVCVLCFVASHQLHRCSDVDKEAAEFRRTISSDTERLSIWMAQSSLKKQSLEKERENFVKLIRDTELAIKQKGEWLKALVDKHSRRLADDVESIKEKRLENMLKEEEDITRHLNILDAVKTYSDIGRSGSAADVCREVNELHKRTEELQAINDVKIQRQNAVFKVTFVAFEVEEILKNRNIVGEIKAQVEEARNDGLFSQVDLGTLTRTPNELLKGVTKKRQGSYVTMK